MSCLENKPKEWKLPGKYGCKKCFATHNKKGKLCKPEKRDDAEKKDAGKKKGKKKPK